MSSIIAGVSIIIGSLLFGFVAISFILIWIKSHRLRIRDTLNDKAYIEDHWVFEKKDKDSGVMWWVSVRGKSVLKCPKPPARALDIGPRGKKYAECYKISEDEYIWITDGGIKFKDVKQENGKTKRIYLDVQKDGTYKEIDSFKPFSEVQRETIVNQYKKAQEMRSKRWTADKVVAMTSILGLVMLTAMLMIFWGDLAKPILDMDGNLQAREKRLYEREQQLCAEIKGGSMQTTPPTQTGSVIVQSGTDPPIEK